MKRGRKGTLDKTHGPKGKIGEEKKLGHKEKQKVKEKQPTKQNEKKDEEKKKRWTDSAIMSRRPVLMDTGNMPITQLTHGRKDYVRFSLSSGF